jgi:hypothetical protein
MKSRNIHRNPEILLIMNGVRPTPRGVATDTESAENKTVRTIINKNTTMIETAIVANTFHSPQLTNPLFKQEGQQRSVMELMVLE